MSLILPRRRTSTLSQNFSLKSAIFLFFLFLSFSPPGKITSGYVGGVFHRFSRNLHLCIVILFVGKGGGDPLKGDAAPPLVPQPVLPRRKCANLGLMLKKTKVPGKCNCLYPVVLCKITWLAFFIFTLFIYFYVFLFHLLLFIYSCVAFNFYYYYTLRNVHSPYTIYYLSLHLLLPHLLHFPNNPTAHALTITSLQNSSHTAFATTTAGTPQHSTPAGHFHPSD